ncbi:carbon-nitrogen hydrolase family protein [bacterium]|nr:carbon-nitrogen hydrolase family protein [bacterium]
MKCTVCQISDNPEKLVNEWQQLIEHVESQCSELVLLPEMPFASWPAAVQSFDDEVWRRAIGSHDEWLHRLSELAPARVLGSRPVNRNGARLNEGFIWDTQSGYKPVHAKYYLPNEAGFWEAHWYKRGDFDFTLAQTEAAKVGFLICTEMWFTDRARAYAKDGVHILASPRATAMTTAEKWVAGGRAAAVMSGAYCLSSNRGGVDQNGMEWAGQGWIIEPEEGEVLALTCSDRPFVTLELDLKAAERAKQTYPRYVPE